MSDVIQAVVVVNSERYSRLHKFVVLTSCQSDWVRLHPESMTT